MLELDKGKAEAPVLLRQANVLRSKKPSFDFIERRLFDPRSKALELDKGKAEAPVLLRQANVLRSKKPSFDFIERRLFDPRSKALKLDKGKAELAERLFLVFRKLFMQMGKDIHISSFPTQEKIIKNLSLLAYLSITYTIQNREKW
ncbi:hypothetical protein QYG89_00405 [Bacillus sp. B190/17]|uniref:Uncharacterized protein n=1 Tax=Bacillus lumedeiriae TaxID=3058829 RepID=A0ABW8I553_9BACI